MFEQLLQSGIVKCQTALVVKDGSLVQEKKFFLVSSISRGELGKMFQISFDPLTGKNLDEMNIETQLTAPRKRNKKN